MPANACELQRDSAPASLDERGRTNYTHRYRITTDEDTWPAAAANDCLASGTNPGPQTLPAMWSGHTIQVNDQVSRLKNRAVDFLDGEKSRREFLVTDTYSPYEPGEFTFAGGGNGQGGEGFAAANPVLRPAEWWVEREVYSHRVEKDKAGVEIINSAGQPFDVDPEIERTRAVLAARYNVETLADVISLNRTYEDTVNLVEWKGIPARAALCREVSAGRIVTEGDFTYHPITFRFSLHQAEPDRKDESAGTWDIGILQRGFSAFAVDQQGVKLDPPKLGRIMSDRTVDGSELPNGFEQSRLASAEPLKLAADGTVLPLDKPGIFKFSRVRQERDFNEIAKLI